MAYDSDARVKNSLKEISRKSNLKNLELRIFDESNDDQKHWTKGGLTFGPIECLYGSCDAGWFINKPYYKDDKLIYNKTPFLIVEGSYGTESGNTGSAQYARFSHALGACKEGFIGVYYIPFKSIYRKGDSTNTTAKVRPEMMYAALNASQIEKGEYLIMDAYDEELMIDFLKILDEGNQERINNFLDIIKQKMKKFADENIVRCRDNNLYDNKRVGRLLMFNVVAFSSYNYRTGQKYRAGRFRNGHTILGDGLITRYRFKKEIDIVLPRFTHNDCKKLDESKQKEWLLLRTFEGINIVTLDDLDFDNDDIKRELYNFLDNLPLLGDNLKKKNQFVKKLKKGFKYGNIKVDYDRVRENEYRGNLL